MKKAIILFGFIIYGIHSYAQENVTVSKNDSIVDLISYSLCNICYDIVLRDRYKLYPTENIYNFLKLDTATGLIYQVQWSLKEAEEGTFVLNNLNLALYTDHIEERPGTFELYPTKNMYQFLLVNKTTGTMWHVQWGLKDSERWIKRIY